MSNILNSNGYKVASISEDGHVRNVQDTIIGRVANNGDVFNAAGEKAGSFRSDGYVYILGKHVGTIHSDGKVYDSKNHYVGKTEGAHIESGGAALLLLVR